MLINLNKVFTEKIFNLHILFCLLKYLLAILIVVLSIYTTLWLTFTTAITLLLFIFFLIFIEQIKEKNKISISICEQEIILNESNKKVTIFFDQILSLSIIFESYNGKGPLFSLWSELGYNQIKIKIKGEDTKKIIFQLKNKKEYTSAIQNAKLLKEKALYKVKLTTFLFGIIPIKH